MKTVFINLIKITKTWVVCGQVCKKYLDLIKCFMNSKHVLGYIMLNSPLQVFLHFVLGQLIIYSYLSDGPVLVPNATL